MVGVCWSHISTQLRQDFAAFVRENPSEVQQLHYLQSIFPQFTCLEINQIFEILSDGDSTSNFQNLNLDNRVPQNQNLRSQFQNQSQVNPDQHQHTLAVQQPPNLPTIMTTTYVDDSFLVDINPGTTEGAKLYLKAIAATSEDDKFDISITSAQKFLDLVQNDTQRFGWGSLVRLIPVSATDTKNMLKDHRSISEDDIRRQAFITWGDHAATVATELLATNTLEV